MKRDERNAMDWTKRNERECDGLDGTKRDGLDGMWQTGGYYAGRTEDNVMACTVLNGTGLTGTRWGEVSAPQSPAEPHSWNGYTVTFHGTVVAKRKESTGKVKVLLHWVPENILPDSWEPENQSTEKVVALSTLSADDLHTLNLWPKDLPTPCQSLSGSRRRKRK
ncbi:hypothetical protein MRX96_027879 [Rhipicephalus microplus]